MEFSRAKNCYFFGGGVSLSKHLRFGFNLLQEFLLSMDVMTELSMPWNRWEKRSGHVSENSDISGGFLVRVALST